MPPTKVYDTEDRENSPFIGLPSGSHWGLPHLEWLRVYEEWDSGVDKLLTKKSNLEDPGAIVQFFQENLSLSWSEALKGNHVTGSFYDTLFQLASSMETTRVYQPGPLLASSCPARTDDSHPVSPSASPRATPDEDEEFQPPSSPPLPPSNSVDETNPDTKLEKDVELTASAFLHVVANALKSTGAGITDVEAQEQALKLSVG